MNAEGERKGREFVRFVVVDLAGNACEVDPDHWEACAMLADGVAFIEKWRASHQGAINETEVKDRTDGLARCRMQLTKLVAR